MKRISKHIYSDSTFLHVVCRRLFSTFLVYAFFSASSVYSQYSDNTPALSDFGPPDLVHMLDMEIIDNTAYVVGSGGYWVFDVSDPSNPVLNNSVTNNLFEMYSLAIRDSIMFTCERFDGLGIYDVTKSEPVYYYPQYRSSYDSSYEYAIFVEDYLYLAAHGQGVEVTDVSILTRPELVSRVFTTNAFALVQVDDYVFVADGDGGLTVLDVSDPAAPVNLNTVSTNGFAIDIGINGTYAFVAVGSSGMDVFDISNPESPLFITNYHESGFTNRIVIENDLAYLANWETVEIVDISDPNNPLILATQHAFLRAMAIGVQDNTFYVGDWSRLRIYRYDDITAPDINTVPLSLSFGVISPGLSQSLTLTVENLGHEPLEVLDVNAQGEFSLNFSPFVLDPFETKEIPVFFSPNGTGRISSFVTIRSDDPDEPVKIVPLIGGQDTNNIGIGDIPPDLELLDTDGNLISMESILNKNKIVVLVMFATW